MQCKLSLIVPCYNEETALPIFYRECTAVLQGMDCEYELLLVDDGSRDGTLSCMKALSAGDERVRYVSFSRNFGKEAAMYAGFCNTEGDYVAVMDADMQDPPSLLPQMLDILQSGEYDSVATRRETRTGEPPLRSWFARRFYGLINRISDADVVDGARDFRLMKREMVDAIIYMGESGRFSKGIFGWIGFRTCWLPYENVERVAGETKWSFWKLFRYAIDGIVNFSQVPLQIAAWLGSVMIGGSLLALLPGLFDDPLSDRSAILCTLFFVGGLVLLCLGIMGRYIAGIFAEVKGRPHYIIAETNRENAERFR